jgi:penicillin-binding protein 1C
MKINVTRLKKQAEDVSRKVKNFVPKAVDVVYQLLETAEEQIGFKFPKLRTMMKRKSRSRKRRAGSIFAPQNRQLFYAKLLRFFAFGSLIGVVGGVLLFFVLFAWFSRNLPKPGEVVRRQGFSTKIYDRNDQLLFDLFDEERRTPISIEDVPIELQHAVVAIEDKSFYEHQGFDFLTILRIPYNVIFKQRVIGGSTLTQQLVKNALLTNERSVTRKFKELVLSMQIERKFTKDQILEMYLNEAPYGGTAWGVGTAAEVYFNKPVNDLTLVESAILAGLPQRPSAYSPYTGRTDDDGEPLWKVRTRGVLIRMRDDEYISEAAYQQALGDLDNVVFEKSAIDINAPHFVFYVRDLLSDLYGDEAVEAGGFKVTTTLDLDLQNQAQEIVKEEVDKVEDLDISNGAALIMDPRNGEILSMVGSRDYNNDEIGGQYNVVVDGLRQPGSSIKPVTYLAMMQRGYNPSSMVMDVETVFTPHENAKEYKPKNYDGQFRGPVSLRNSLGSSLNIPAVKSLATVGVDSFLSLAYDMGFVTLEPTKENMTRFGLAVTLGGAEVHMIDIATAYSSFANYGEKVEPVAILKIEDSNGNVIFEHKPVQGRKVIEEEEAFLINNILSDNNARAIAFGTGSLLNVSPNIAVKTGTTNDQKDNWAIGWSQEIMVAAWVGNNDNTSMSSVTSGVSGATPIWRNIILKALDMEGYSAPEWKVPEGVEQVSVDKVSGYPEHDGLEARSDYVIKGTLQSLPDPIHPKLNLCKGKNKLAPSARVSSGDFEKKEFFILNEEDPFSTDGKNRWQEAIDLWLAEQGDTRYHPPTEYCGDEGEIYVSLKDPDNEKNYDDEDIKIKIESDSPSGIEKLEIYVNGSKRETINDRKHEGKLNLPAGKYEIYVKAYSKDDKKKETGKVKIGTGGVKWNEPDPTPIPTPTPTPATPPPTPEPLSCNETCDSDAVVDLCEDANVLWFCDDVSSKCRSITDPLSEACVEVP